MPRPLPRSILLLFAPWLVLVALAAPLNHDESQYVAGAVVAARGMPFRDFLALQPPLALWVWAPLTVAFAGWSFVAIRLSSALFGAVTILCVAQAEGRERRWPIGAMLLACCHAFLYTSGIARNDALPGMLLALGMVAGMRGEAGRLGIAGLMLGLAGAAKLSFLPALAAGGIALLIGYRDVRAHGIAAYALGGAIGLLPLLAGWLAAPEAFWFGVFRFGASAPFDWYRQVGQASDLTLIAKLIDTGGAMLVGPALAALVIVAIGINRLPATHGRRWLGALTIGGLVGALLPTPSHPQYLLPLLPPLFALLPDCLDRLPYRRGATAFLAVFAVIGLAPSIVAIGKGFPLLSVETTAHAIGRVASGPIATLSPDRAADSGLALDPRFATGPFVFRSGAALSPAEAWRFGVATPATLAPMFALSPPRAILTGYEPGWKPGAPAADAPLERWATAHHYALRMLPDGRGKLYLAPQPTGGRS